MITGTVVNLTSAFTPATIEFFHGLDIMDEMCGRSNYATYTQEQALEILESLTENEDVSSAVRKNLTEILEEAQRDLYKGALFVIDMEVIYPEEY